MDQRVEEFTKERKEKLDIRKTQFLIPLLLDSFQNERVSEEALLERAEECERSVIQSRIICSMWCL